VYEYNRCVASSYLAIRCESLRKGRLWMKTTPGPVRDAVSWLSPCIRWHISVQVKYEPEQSIRRYEAWGGRGSTHPKDCSSRLVRTLQLKVNGACHSYNTSSINSDNLSGRAKPSQLKGGPYLHIIITGRQILCDEDREKHNVARSISRRNTAILDWFSPSREVIVVRPVFALLCCEIWDPL
jgi:hypothetical protein